MILTNDYQYIGRTDGVGCDKGGNYYVLLYAKTSGNISTGKHTVSVKMRIASEKTHFFNFYTDGAVEIDGESAIFWENDTVPDRDWNKEQLTVGGYTYERWVDLKEGSAEINTHYAEMDITINASWKRRQIAGDRPDYLPYVKTITASIGVTLPPMVVASDPSVSTPSVKMLEELVITTNRVFDQFTHELTYSFAGIDGVIATNVGESYTWTVPDLTSKIPGMSNGICTITCKTKNGSTTVGIKSISVTIKVPEASTVSVSSTDVKMGASVDINIKRNSSAYTHTLLYSIGEQVGVINRGVAGKTLWTPPKELANNTNNQLSVQCTITCYTYNGNLCVGESSETITLKVPDATKPSVSATSIVLGTPIIIYTPREASCYEHWITYILKAKDSPEEVFSEGFDGAVQESCEWTPPLNLAMQIPSATEGIITIICETRFRGSSTVVGKSAPISFAITIPDNSATKPIVTMNFSAKETFNNFFLSGKSKVEVTYQAKSSYSEIKSYSTTVKKGEDTLYTSEENPYTSGVLPAGDLTIIGKVTDERGYSTETTEKIHVLDYSRPRIIPGDGENNVVCVRCNSDGKPDPAGAYLLIGIGRKYSKVQGNYCSVSYQWKTDAQDDTKYSNLVELPSAEETSGYVNVVIPEVVTSNTTAYDIRLIAMDTVGETDTVTIVVPTAFATWHVPSGGHGVTLGGYHDPSKYNVFDCRFDAEFQGDVIGRVLGMGKLPKIAASADLNIYKGFGVWAVDDDVTAKDLSNCPAEKAGTLRVWSANGSGKTEGSNVYILQEYICSDNSAAYRRSIQLLSEESLWEYGPWKTIG